MRAYLALLLAPSTNGVKAVRLARFGAYEVRLVELVQDLVGGFTLWLELYAHDIGRSLDSCGCEVFDEAAGATDALIAQAREMHRQGAPA